MDRSLSTELALKAFDADAALSTALAEFQSTMQPAGTIIEEAQRATAFGFSWFTRPSEPGPWEVILRHSEGAENNAKGASVTALLAGLLGHPLAQDVAVLVAAQAAEPEQEEEAAPSPTAAILQAVAEVQCPAEAPPTPSPAQVAAESLAASTGGVVVTEPSEYVPDPEQPLTNQEKADAEAMLRGFTPEKRKRFTISYRDAFRISREEKGILPTVTQWKHLQYFYNWETEANGSVAA